MATPADALDFSYLTEPSEAPAAPAVAPQTDELDLGYLDQQTEPVQAETATTGPELGPDDAPAIGESMLAGENPSPYSPMDIAQGIGEVTLDLGTGFAAWLAAPYPAVVEALKAPKGEGWDGYAKGYWDFMEKYGTMAKATGTVDPRTSATGDLLKAGGHKLMQAFEWAASGAGDITYNISKLVGDTQTRVIKNVRSSLVEGASNLMMSPDSKAQVLTTLALMDIANPQHPAKDSTDWAAMNAAVVKGVMYAFPGLVLKSGSKATNFTVSKLTGIPRENIPFGKPKPKLSPEEFLNELNKNPDLTGFDNRPWKEVRDSSYETVFISKLHKDKYGATQGILEPDYKFSFNDIPLNTHGPGFDWHRIVQSPRAMAQWFKNPVMRWAVTKGELIRQKYEGNAQALLYHGDFKFREGRHGITVPEMVPGPNSPLLMYKKLSEHDAANVGRALNWNSPWLNWRGKRAMEATDAELAAGWKNELTGDWYFEPMSPEQIATYRAFRNALDVAHDTYNRSIEIGNPNSRLAPIEHIHGYWPAIFPGDFKISAHAKYQVSGKERNPAAAMRSVSTRFGLEKAQRELEAQYPPDKYDYHMEAIADPRRKHPDAPLNAFLHMRNLAKKATTPEEQALFEKLMQQEYGVVKGFAGHSKERQGTRGFLGDPSFTNTDKQMVKDIETVFTSYIRGSQRAASINEMRGLMESTIFNDAALGKNRPNTVAYVREYLDQFSGHRNWMDDFVWSMENGLTGGLIHKWFGVDGIRIATTTVSSKVAWMKLMFHNLRFMVPQTMQASIMVPPHLERLRAAGAQGSVSKAWSQSHLDLVFPDAEFRQAALVAARKGTFSPNFIRFLEEREWKLGKNDVVGQSPYQKLVDFGKGYTIPSWIEEMSRLQAFSMYYRFMRDSGLNPTRAGEMASRETAYFMTEYHRSQKPTTVSGGELTAAMQFKTFSLNYFSQALQHLKTMRETGEVGPLALSLASQAFAAGVTGVIWVGLADSTINSINQVSGQNIPTVSEYMATADIPNTILYGAPQALANRDMASLDAPGFTDVKQLLSVPQISWAWDIGAAAHEITIAKLHGGSIPAPKLAQLYKQLLPTSLHGVVESYVETGQLLPPSEGEWLVHNPNYKYHGLLKRDAAEFRTRVLSQFRSLEERRLAEFFMSTWKRNKRADDLAGKFVADFAYQYVNAPEAIDWQLAMDVAKNHYGIGHQEFIRDVRREAEAQAKDLKEVLALTGISGNSKRAYQAMLALQQLLPILERMEKEKAAGQPEELDLQSMGIQ